MSEKVTIDELEKMLNEPDALTTVTVLPNGEVRSVRTPLGEQFDALERDLAAAREECERLRGTIVENEVCWEALLKERDALRAENERLKNELLAATMLLNAEDRELLKQATKEGL